MTGRGLPDRFEEFARPKPVISCRRCGDEVRRRFVDQGVCVGCRHRPMTDGGDREDDEWDVEQRDLAGDRAEGQSTLDGGIRKPGSDAE